MEANEDWQAYFLGIIKGRYGGVISFGHHYVLDHTPSGRARTLEIGAGLGEHLVLEKERPDLRQGYMALDVRPEMLAALHAEFPDVETILADCQKTIR